MPNVTQTQTHTMPTPLFLRITDVIPTETHCVPRSNRYPYNSLAWWFFRKFSIFLKWPSMYSLKWLHLYRLPVRQTYQRKCFRLILLWKCGSFRDSRITDTPRSCIVYAVRPYSWGLYSIRARVWSISVVYRVGVFHNLHRINERGSTLLFITNNPIGVSGGYRLQIWKT